MLKLIITEETGETTEQMFEDSDIVTLGRAETNRIVVSSRRASRNHCRITFEAGHWTVEDLGSQNGTRVNKEKISQQTLENGDEIQIADFRIVVELPGTEKVPETESDDKTVVFDRPAIDPDATTFGLATPFTDQNEPVSSMEKIKAAIIERKVLILSCVLGLFVLLIVTRFFKSETPQDQQVQVIEKAVEKVDTIEDLALNKKIKNYLAAGRELFDRGDYAKALSRFQMVLAVAPENSEAIQYVDKCRVYVEREAEKEKELAEKKLKLQERAADLLVQARQYISDNAYREARDLLSEAVYLDPENTVASDLLNQVDTRMAKEEQQRAETEKSNQEKLAEMKTRFSQGQALFSRKQYPAALQEWERVVRLGLDVPELYEAQKKISEVQQILAKTVEKDYQKGMTYYKQKKYGDAATYLQRVVNIFPEYKDAKKILTNVVEKVEDKAKTLYQEGLVYEGIGQMDKARRKWEAVLKAMPFENNEYHQKAKEKLNR